MQPGECEALPGWNGLTDWLECCTGWLAGLGWLAGWLERGGHRVAARCVAGWISLAEVPCSALHLAHLLIFSFNSIFGA